MLGSDPPGDRQERAEDQRAARGCGLPPTRRQTKRARALGRTRACTLSTMHAGRGGAPSMIEDAKQQVTLP
jgi:hypothetical protein